MTGEWAVATPSMADLSLTWLAELSDQTAADQAIRSVLEVYRTGRTIETSGVRSTVKATLGRRTPDGVALHTVDTTVDSSKLSTAQLSAAQRKQMASTLSSFPTQNRAQVATFDAFGMVVFHRDSLAEASRTIDAARGKAPHFVPSAALAPLLAGSRARKDSMVIIADLGAFLTVASGHPVPGDLPALISLGYAEHNARIHVALPAATLRAVVNL
jgi:hypothetical protein